MILRYFLILTLPVLASCTFPWSSVPVDERTFESDYAQVMSTQFSGLIS